MIDVSLSVFKDVRDILDWCEVAADTDLASDADPCVFDILQGFLQSCCELVCILFLVCRELASNGDWRLLILLLFGHQDVDILSSPGWVLEPGWVSSLFVDLCDCLECSLLLLSGVISPGL